MEGKQHKIYNFSDSADKIAWFMCDYNNGTDFRLLEAKHEVYDYNYLYQLMQFQLEIIKNPRLN